MKILIDGRPLQTYSRYRGIGRYVDIMIELFGDNDECYFLFFKGDDIDRRPKNKIIMSSPRRGITFTDRFFLPSLLKKNEIDVYHSTAYALPVKQGNPVFILTIYDITPLLFPRFSTFKNRFIFKKILQTALRADRIVAISNSTKNDLIRVTEIPEEVIRVIYPGLYLKGTEIPDTIVPMKGIPEEFVLYSGGFDGNKNVKTIVKALNIFRKPLVMTGMVREEIKQELTGLLSPGTRELIHFTGYVSDHDLKALYGKARVFLFPSLYEGFGFPPLEALEQGTPSVTSRAGSLKEVLRDAALFVTDPLDEIELAEKTAELWDDRSKREELVEKGREVLRLYSSDRFKDDMMELYRSLHRTQD